MVFLGRSMPIFWRLLKMFAVKALGSAQKEAIRGSMPSAQRARRFENNRYLKPDQKRTQRADFFSSLEPSPWLVPVIISN